MNNLFDILRQQALQYPERVAFYYERQRITFKELFSLAENVANNLYEYNLPSQTHVVILMERSFAFIATIYGVLASGHVCIPVDPADPSKRKEILLAEAQAGAIITQGSSEYITRSTSIALLQSEQLLDTPIRRNVPVNGSMDDIAFIFFTSGTTAIPKGVRLTHRALYSGQQWLQSLFRLTAADRQLFRSTTTVTNIVREIFWPTLAGASGVIVPASKHLDIEYQVDLIRDANVSVFLAVPKLLQAYLEVNAIETCKAMRYIFCSSDVMPADLPERILNRLPNVAVYNIYGLTEALYAAYWKCGYDRFPSQSSPIGYPAELDLYVLDSDLKPLPNDTVGDLYVGGVGMAVDYLNNPSLTKQKFVNNLFCHHRYPLLYNTGDLASRSATGIYYLHGRSDDMVKINGNRVELSEVENCLKRCPGIKDAVVVGKSRGDEGYYLSAFIVPLSNEAVETKHMRDHALTYLPGYMAPTEYVFLSHIPLTHNGKVDRKYLQETQIDLYESNASSQAHTTTEEYLLNIWEEVFKKKPHSIDINFFDFGGDSVLALLIALKAARKGADIKVRDIFTFQTIRSLANEVTTRAPRALPTVMNTPDYTTFGWSEKDYNDILAVLFQSGLVIDSKGSC